MEPDDKTLQEEFSHAQGTTYLDHAGATLYSRSQLDAHFADLSTHLYGNPHSHNLSSLLTTEAVDNVREIVLHHFNTDSTEYDVIFTSGCTAALKLLAECFPWSGVNSGGDIRKVKRSTRNTSQTSQTGSANKFLEVESEVFYIPNITHSTISSELNDEGFPHCRRNIDSNTSVFCYLEDNHTSVVGMREVAGLHGATLVCVTEDNVRYPSSNKAHSIELTTCENVPPYHLFAYPAQSNFSGRKYPLNWTRDFSNGTIKLPDLQSLKGTWKVVLDAASYVSTSPLDLSLYRPHFVTLSFYKMCGYPTGLGALLVRKDCGHLLQYKEFYGGGTVLATVSRSGYRIPRVEVHERFEDGTLPFLDIIALSHGFKTMIRIGKTMDNISQHTFQLASYTYKSLSTMRHSNGRIVTIIYSDTDFSDPSTQGPIISFNLLQTDGQLVGYGAVEKLATVHGVHLRTGCFCNTGACMKHLGLSEERVRQNVEAGHVCGDSIDLIDGFPTGCVRISFGYMSTLKDAQIFLQFIDSCFVEKDSDPVTKEPTQNSPLATREDVSTNDQDSLPPAQHENTDREEGSGIVREGCTSPLLRVGERVEATLEDGSCVQAGVLQQISVYPVKGCPAFTVTSWPIGAKGLLYDREWMVLSEHGSVLRQKQEGKLCLVRPLLDLKAGKLLLHTEGASTLEIPLHSEDTEKREQPRKDQTACSTRLFGDKVQSTDCGDEAATWLRGVLGRECRLVRQNPHIIRPLRTATHKSKEIPLSLANIAQYLLISESSVEKLHSDIVQRHQNDGNCEEIVGLKELLARFRANFAVGGSELDPYVEERWKKVQIGELMFEVTDGCSRCQVICVDQVTGRKSAEPLRTLMAQQGSTAHFGMYLMLRTPLWHWTL